MHEGKRTLTGYLLVASLALNMLLGGYFMAGMLRHPFHPPDPFAGLPNPQRIREVLPDSRRELLHTVLEIHLPEVRKAMDALFATQKEVAEAIRAEPFDAAALQKILDIYAARQQELILVHQATVSDLIRRLDAGDRARVAELLKLPPRPKGKGGFPPPGD
ncbi:MAG: periplasmic heavy metal sensor [Desulfovibrio sp.]